jgi:hypothetical protein
MHARVREALQDGSDVVLPGMAGDLEECGHGLVMEDVSEERPNGWDRHRLVDERDAGQR